MSFIPFKSSFASASTLLTRAIKAFDNAHVVRPDVPPVSQAIPSINSSVTENAVFIVASPSEEADLMSWSTSNLLFGSASSLPSTATDEFQEEQSCSSRMLPSLPSSFSWSAFCEATEPSCLTPEILVTSPSTSSIFPADDETDICYLKLTPHGFISREMLRMVAEIDFDDDYSEPPMLLAPTLRLQPLSTITEEEEEHIEPFTEPTNTPVCQRTTLPTISEVDDFRAEKETTTEFPVPESNFSSMMLSMSASFSWSDIRADQTVTASFSIDLACAVPTLFVTSPSSEDIKTEPPASTSSLLLGPRGFVSGKTPALSVHDGRKFGACSTSTFSSAYQKTALDIIAEEGEPANFFVIGDDED